MPEIRFEAKSEVVAVLDGYCAATGKCRTSFINALLEDWAKAKLHEAIVVCHRRRKSDRTGGRQEMIRSLPVSSHRSAAIVKSCETRIGQVA